MFGRRIIKLIIAGALFLALSGPAVAGGAEVSSGRFVTLPGGTGLGHDIDGRAVMVRMPAGDGTTFVVVHIRGLDPDLTYPTHVHNAPCSAVPAGGSHYQHDVGGAVDTVNEIWPTVHTNAVGNGAGYATHDNWARADAMSIVVHYPANTSIRIACADLN
jgi:hypothetical protein